MLQCMKQTIIESIATVVPPVGLFHSFVRFKTKMFTTILRTPPGFKNGEPHGWVSVHDDNDDDEDPFSLRHV